MTITYSSPLRPAHAALKLGGHPIGSRPIGDRRALQIEGIPRTRARTFVRRCHFMEGFRVVIGSVVAHVFLHLGARQRAVCTKFQWSLTLSSNFLTTTANLLVTPISCTAAAAQQTRYAPHQSTGPHLCSSKSSLARSSGAAAMRC